VQQATRETDLVLNRDEETAVYGSLLEYPQVRLAPVAPQVVAWLRARWQESALSLPPVALWVDVRL
jgi:hypothetical protein